MSVAQETYRKLQKFVEVINEQLIGCQTFFLQNQPRNYPTHTASLAKFLKSLHFTNLILDRIQENLQNCLLFLVVRYSLVV